MKREIPLLITFIAGFLIVVALFIPHPPFNKIEETFNSWYIIVAGFTFILGIDSLILHNWEKIRRRSEGWPFALTVILSFFITLIWGIVSGVRTGHIFSTNSTFRNYFYLYIYVPLQATMFAILSFFIASAAYRAFRARTLNATLLLLTASIVMLGRVPLGNVALIPVISIAVLMLLWVLVDELKYVTSPTQRLIYIGIAVVAVVAAFPITKFLYHNLSPVTDWIMNVPQMAAKRGLFIGLALGGIAVSLRIILGIEQSYMS